MNGGIIVMKNFKSKLGGMVAKCAFKVTKMNVNSACCFFTYQPKLPQSAKKLRKF